MKSYVLFYSYELFLFVLEFSEYNLILVIDNLGALQNS